MNTPPAVPLNWLSRAKIRIAPIDDGVVADEQKTIDLYFRSGLIKQKLNAADIVDRSFSVPFGKGVNLYNVWLFGEFLKDPAGNSPSLRPPWPFRTVAQGRPPPYLPALQSRRTL